MPREAVDKLLNLSDPAVKHRLKRFIDAAKGVYRFCVEPDGDTRTQRQNRTWWALCVTPLAERMREQFGLSRVDERLKLAAHGVLVKACIGFDEVMDPLTGAMVEMPRPTHNLSRDDFSDLWEKACCELAQIGIIVEDPNPDYLDVRRQREAVSA